MIGFIIDEELTSRVGKSIEFHESISPFFILLRARETEAQLLLAMFHHQVFNVQHPRVLEELHIMTSLRFETNLNDVGGSGGRGSGHGG